MPPQSKSWLVPVLLAVSSLLLSGWVSYTQQHEGTRVDVSVIQNQQRNDHERLERIERKVDEIIGLLRTR